MTKRSGAIILGVTGSIAAYKSAEIIRGFQEEGFAISVVMTKEAEQFITPLTLASLSGRQVFHSLFDEKENAWQMNHIQLAKEALAVLIAPATANIIGKLACGLADDLLTCIVLATKAPIFLAPAMNNEMYNNRIVQENCQKLKKWGMTFIEPKEGKLACGVFGEGHIAEIDDIVSAVKEKLSI